MDDITDLMDMSLSELRELVMEAWRAAIHGIGKVLKSMLCTGGSDGDGNPTVEGSV